MKKLSRRAALQAGAAAAAAGAGLLGASAAASPPKHPADSAEPAHPGPSSARTPGGSRTSGGFRMPDERRPHARTFLAWPPAGPVWGRYARDAQRDIAAIARTLAAYEPVVVLARPEDVRAVHRRCGGAAEVWPVPVDDLWIRDTGPLFVAEANDGHRPADPTRPTGTGEGEANRPRLRPRLHGLDLGFNGWGRKQTHARDHLVARRVLARAHVPRHRPALTAEGGSLETDGEGTLLATESSLVNGNRNPGMTRDDVERELRRALGVDTVLWVDGVRGQDITDCHIDALARFTEPGVVVLSRPAHAGSGHRDVWTRVYEQARRTLREVTDARGRRLDLVELPEADPASLPGDRGPDFLGSYANHYVANGAVLLPRFGDRRADDRAAGVLRELYPGRDVRAVAIDTVASGGGGIHCATQQQPAHPGHT